MDVTVSEGTSMSVSVSPDGRTLAADLQGSIWTMPPGRNDDRITGVFDDARQPAWSPDGTAIAYFAYRDGGYDLWSITADGTKERRPHDGAVRRPRAGLVATAPGSRSRPIAEAPSRAGNYNIWILDLRGGTLRQVTSHAAEDSMPSWSPDDRRSYSRRPRERRGPWATDVASGTERKAARDGASRCALVGPSGTLLYHDTVPGESRYEVDGAPLTGNENVFAFRASWSSPTEFYYVSDGKIRKRTLGGTVQTVPFTATLRVKPPRYTQRRRDFDSTAPRKAMGIVRLVISPDGLRRGVGRRGRHVMDIGAQPGT